MKTLHGHTILVVEDDWFIASYLESVLETAGAALLGPCASAAEALALLDERAPDAATLNFRVADDTSLPVADRLAAMGKPFLFVSATAEADLPERFRDRPALTKPFAGFQVVDEIARLIG